MSIRMRLTRTLLPSGLLLTAVFGCAGTQAAPPAIDAMTSGGITDQREQRHAEVVVDFEQKRDFAEFQAARAYWLRWDLRGCESRLQRLLMRSPNHRDSLLLLADIYLTTKRPEQAYQLARRALQGHPGDAKVQHTMGLVLDATGRTDEALAHYQQAVEVEPDNELYGIGYCKALEAVHHKQGAAARAAWAIKARPQPPAAPAVVPAVAPLPTPKVEPVQRATHAASTEGAGSADRALHVEEDGVPALIRQGVDALAGGEPEKAVERFQRASSMRPDDPQIPIQAAVEALRADQPTLATVLLCEAAKQFPTSVDVHRALGVAYYRLGDYQSSQVSLQQALSLDKSSALTYFLMGCTLAKLGESEASETHFRQARTLDPNVAERR